MQKNTSQNSVLYCWTQIIKLLFYNQNNSGWQKLCCVNKYVNKPDVRFIGPFSTHKLRFCQQSIEQKIFQGFPLSGYWSTHTKSLWPDCLLCTACVHNNAPLFKYYNDWQDQVVYLYTVYLFFCLNGTTVIVHTSIIFIYILWTTLKFHDIQNKAYSYKLYDSFKTLSIIV